MSFHDAPTPEDLPASHHGEPVIDEEITMETNRHVHVCACGERWECSKVDCHIADECSRCEDEAVAAYFDGRQPVLEPVEALLSAQGDDDAS